MVWEDERIRITIDACANCTQAHRLILHAEGGAMERELGKEHASTAPDELTTDTVGIIAVGLTRSAR
jgi:hypothetical protein